MGLDILIGGGGAGPDTAAGAGFFFNILQNETAGVITSIKLKFTYLFTANVNPEGSLLVTLSGQLGI